MDIERFIGTSEWSTARRNAGWLLHDALNGATPQIFDTIVEDGVEKRVLNSEATEAAKEKLARIKDAFTAWVWTDPDRTDRLARVYNDRFSNLVPRWFDGRHLTLPAAPVGGGTPPEHLSRHWPPTSALAPRRRSTCLWRGATAHCERRR